MKKKGNFVVVDSLGQADVYSYDEQYWWFFDEKTDIVDVVKYHSPDPSSNDRTHIAKYYRPVKVADKPC